MTHAMTRQDVIRFLVLRSVGNFLVLFSVFGVAMTFGPALYEEVRFRTNQVRGVTYTIADPTNTKTFNKQQSLLVNSSNNLIVPYNTAFDIVIPRIGANAEIIPNIDPSDEQTYLAALKKGVAHARGSVFPGMTGTTYLFAHSTDNWYDVGRYNAIFYLLKDMQPYDDITIFFSNKRYDYKVQNVQIVDPTEVGYLVNAQTSPEQLVLQTCWPPGTTFKRLLVVATPSR
jgi:LPXTG-site transpeptidase (sortase) family protein